MGDIILERHERGFSIDRSDPVVSRLMVVVINPDQKSPIGALCLGVEQLRSTGRTFQPHWEIVYRKDHPMDRTEASSFCNPDAKSFALPGSVAERLYGEYGLDCVDYQPTVSIDTLAERGLITPDVAAFANAFFCNHLSKQRATEVHTSWVRRIANKASGMLKAA